MNKEQIKDWKKELKNEFWDVIGADTTKIPLWEWLEQFISKLLKQQREKHCLEIVATQSNCDMQKTALKSDYIKMIEGMKIDMGQFYGSSAKESGIYWHSYGYNQALEDLIKALKDNE